MVLAYISAQRTFGPPTSWPNVRPSSSVKASQDNSVTSLNTTHQIEIEGWVSSEGINWSLGW